MKLYLKLGTYLNETMFEIRNIFKWNYVWNLYKEVHLKMPAV